MSTPAYYILSLHGGSGIRTIFTARLLARLEEARPGFMEKFDLISGTSMDGILALLLAMGRSPMDCAAFLENVAQAVFARSLSREISNAGNLLGPRYSVEPLKRLLAGHFGGATMGGVPKRVLIPIFELDNADTLGLRGWRLRLFHNFPGYEARISERVVDVALRATATPLYFPPYQGFVDGMVAGNNHSMTALTVALDRGLGGRKQRDVVMLSVGPGRSPNYVSRDASKWGALRWAPILNAITMDGAASMIDGQCRRLLSRRYHQLSPAFPQSIGLDDVSRMPLLIELSNHCDVQPTVQWLLRYF